MIIVERLFPDEHHLQTEIWVSDAVREAIAEHTRSERPKSGFFLKKLKYHATGGFAEFEGDEKKALSDMNGVVFIASGYMESCSVSTGSTLDQRSFASSPLTPF